MKILINIGFGLFVISFALVVVGEFEYLTPSSIFGGSSLIASAIYSKK
jgi:hypothetical protein